MMGGGPSLFRPEASPGGAANADTRGTVLSIAPPSAMTIFWLATAILVAGALLVGVGDVSVYAEGRGMVSPSEEPTRLRAPFSTVVLSVDKRVGEAGKPGDTVVTLELPPESRSLAECTELVRTARERVETTERQIATLQQANGKQDSALLATMLGAQVASERSRLTSTEQRCKQTEALVGQAQVRFTSVGSVSEVRVVPGQRVQAGEVLAMVLPETSRLVARLVVQEEHRADVEIGKPVRLRFDACPYQDHGVGEGKLTRLLEGSDDDRAATSGQARDPNGGAPRAGFIAEVEIQKLPSGYCSTLRPGMALTGNIFVREQRVGGLLFRPMGK